MGSWAPCVIVDHDIFKTKKKRSMQSPVISKLSPKKNDAPTRSPSGTTTPMRFCWWYYLVILAQVKNKFGEITQSKKDAADVLLSLEKDGQRTTQTFVYLRCFGFLTAGVAISPKTSRDEMNRRMTFLRKMIYIYIRRYQDTTSQTSVSGQAHPLDILYNESDDRDDTNVLALSVMTCCPALFQFAMDMIYEYAPNTSMERLRPVFQRLSRLTVTLHTSCLCFESKAVEEILEILHKYDETIVATLSTIASRYQTLASNLSTTHEC